MFSTGALFLSSFPLICGQNSSNSRAYLCSGHLRLKLALQVCPSFAATVELLLYLLFYLLFFLSFVWPLLINADDIQDNGLIKVQY